jgi:hypothetical protein
MRRASSSILGKLFTDVFRDHYSLFAGHHKITYYSRLFLFFFLHFTSYNSRILNTNSIQTFPFNALVDASLKLFPSIATGLRYFYFLQPKYSPVGRDRRCEIRLTV